MQEKENSNSEICDLENIAKSFWAGHSPTCYV